jgi:hypothetical protein
MPMVAKVPCRTTWVALACICMLSLLMVAASTAHARTTVSGISNPEAPLEIDPGTTGGTTSNELNFYTGSDVFWITEMPDTRRIDRVTIGPIARASSCTGASVQLKIMENGGGVLATSLRFEPLPETPADMTFDIPPTTLRAGRGYRLNLWHGNTFCVGGLVTTWPHNSAVVDGGTNPCLNFPWSGLYYRMWHVRGLADMPICPNPPTNFEPSMPTGWLSVQQSYPSFLVVYDHPFGLVTPRCSTELGQQPRYWKQDPNNVNYSYYACAYPQFSDLGTRVPDGWYHAAPFSSTFGSSPRDMHLKFHPADYTTLKDAHAPTYAFDEDENFFPQRASAFTANWEAPPGGGYVASTDYANLLLNGQNDVLAGAGSPETLGMPQELLLGELAANYGFDGTASSTADYIDARGGDLSTYQADSNRMRDLGHADTRYDRVVSDPDDGKLWVQYWLFYYYNSFETAGIGEHEGDWEMVQVGFDNAQQPDAITFASHTGAYGCTWAEAERAVGSSPIVYVAAKSHASYPHAGSTQLAWILSIDRHRGTGSWSVEPGEDITGYAWPTWRGRWGASRDGSTPSPVNLSQQGDSWSHPSKFHHDHLDPDTC